MPTRRRPVPLILGLGAVTTSVGFLASHTIRDASPIYHALGRVAFLWQVTLLAGGILVLEGVRTKNPKHEAGGLVLVAGGILMYVVGVAWARGAAGWTGGTLLFMGSVAILARALNVARGHEWS